VVEEQGRYVPVDRDSAHPQLPGDPGLNPSVHTVPGQKFQYPEPTFGPLNPADRVVVVPAGLAAAYYVPASRGTPVVTHFDYHLSVSHFGVRTDMRGCGYGNELMGATAQTEFRQLRSIGSSKMQAFTS
jgi:hypothetical protein